MSGSALPERVHTYKHRMMDSARWDGFRPRDGDIIICTAYKAGTTWMQMICALLIFQETDFGRPLTTISPWLDLEIMPIEDVLATYEAQTHRRFVKTHTALDGLPYYENATYLFVGRDPRDILVSMHSHMKNASPEGLRRPGEKPREPGPDRAKAPPDVTQFFRAWISKGSFPWEQDGWPFWSVLHHASTFWAYRDLPNIHLAHYGDLKRDLDGEMRRIARILDIEVEEALWPTLVEAAGFDSMKERADMLAPEVDLQAWSENKRFFNKGTSGQWRDVLTERDLALYGRAVEERLDPALAKWLENGGSSSG